MSVSFNRLCLIPNISIPISSNEGFAVAQDIISRYVDISIVPSKGLVVQFPTGECASGFKRSKHLTHERAPIKKSQLPVVKSDTEKMITDILCANDFHMPRRNVWITYSITNDHT